ncbi:MAG: putative membrane protein [Planctomycetota bacterium]|jgi:uncharacterized membrane protein
MLAPSTFEIIDDGSARSDLAERQEIKYTFNNPDVARIRSVLRRSCRQIVYAEPISNVYSLYFDDPRLSTCLANLDGVDLRHKTRLRWYDRAHLAGDFFFETKWRRNRIVGKKRMQLRGPDIEERFAFRDLHKSLRQSIPSDRIDYLTQDTDAVTLVQYQREHFALDGTNVRITLDYNIRFYPQLGKRTYNLSFPERLSGLVLLECKTDLGEEREIFRAIAPLGARQTRFSKYISACNKLGYATRI